MKILLILAVVLIPMLGFTYLLKLDPKPKGDQSNDTGAGGSG